MPAPPPLNDAISEVLAHLTPFVPLSGAGLPANNVRLASARRKTVGLGHRRGTEHRFGLPVAALGGVRVDGVARFEVWGTTPGDVDTLAQDIHTSLLGSLDALRGQGFLKVEAAETTPAEHVAAVPAWRKTGDFSLLFELRTTTSDDADSFIVRIPVTSDLEEPDSPAQATETVIDDMRRWDNEGALDLVVRGGQPRSRRVTELISFDFLPGGFAGTTVTLERQVAGSGVANAVYPSLNDFLDAVTDPATPDLNAEVSFATLPDFLTELGAPGSPIGLGDWNLDLATDEFLPRGRLFDRPLELPTTRDLFAVRYGAAAFASPAIVYLRVNTR